MSAEVQPSAEEVAEVAEPQVEGQQAQEASTPEPKAQLAERKKRNDQEYNWAEARKKMQELDRQNKELAEKVSQMQKPASQPEEEASPMGKDDIVTYSQMEKLIEKKAAKIAENILRQREAATVDERLSLKFSDYADVVSKENIELLKQEEPELALSIWKLQDDPYAQGIAAYKLMKKLGISDKETPQPDKERAVKNAQKPLSVNAVTKQSALGNAHLFENGLTKELKSQLYKEMREAAKRA